MAVVLPVALSLPSSKDAALDEDLISSNLAAEAASQKHEGKCWKRGTGKDKCFDALDSFGEWFWLKIYITSFHSGIS